MFIKDVKDMVEARSQGSKLGGRKDLLAEIEVLDKRISNELEQFIDIAQQIKVLSIYEVVKTPSVKEVSVDTLVSAIANANSLATRWYICI